MVVVARIVSNFFGRKALKSLLSPNIFKKCGFIALNGTRSSSVFANKVHSYVKDSPAGSRYCPLSPVEKAQEKTSDIFSAGKPQSSEEWNEVKIKLITENMCLNEMNFSSFMMNFLLIKNNIEDAHSFMKYLTDYKISINYLAYLKYMDICGKNIKKCGQDLILELFYKIKPYLDALPILDVISAEHLLNGLCSTDQWRICFDYIKKVPKIQTNQMKNALAYAAIRNDDEKLAWEIITKWLKPDHSPSTKVLIEFVLYATKLQKTNPEKSKSFIEKFLNYLRVRSIVVDVEAATYIADYFKCQATEWSTSNAKMSRGGECSSCKNRLLVNDLSLEDFRYLRDAFLEKSLKKTDLFINTTHDEFKKYIKFIESHKPFDVVIDGLNVAFSCLQDRPVHKFQDRNPKKLAIHLLKIVERFASHSLRILVLGRHHMTTWPSRTMEQINKKSIIFLTNNISQDDPFTVYAALASGPESYIVSQDLMRDHYARLDDQRLIRLFKRWQETHQIVIQYQDKKYKLIEPLNYSINIQGDMQQGWHIPFDDQTVLDSYEELNNWLCIKRNIK